eukprot:TRINITY_DN3254_c0_g1_i1.p1 TRINITY_DN3254_c0_g1~~TRINITY_DN3254_c0_g1_i1.p1  ORF type:complete len:189 (-),score=5.15 TRINITY_DN3254_c0_g1_i1:111-677(-)
MLSNVRIEPSLAGTGNSAWVHFGFWLTPEGKKESIALKLPKRFDIAETLREAEILARLQHEHIVKFFGLHHPEPDKLYICMERAFQGSLESHLTRAICLDDKVLYASHVAKALVYLHSSERSRFHADIAARNVLLFGRVAKLSDFGLSHRVTSNADVLRGLSYPVRWSAPEVLATAAFGPRADMFRSE